MGPRGPGHLGQRDGTGQTHREPVHLYTCRRCKKRVEYELPLHRCPWCGSKQLYRRKGITVRLSNDRLYWDWLPPGNGANNGGNFVDRGN